MQDYIKHEPCNESITADYRKERQEAIEAGEKALASLRKAQEYLNSARDWGIYDIIGGGLISTLVKHDRMDQAGQYISEAREDLRHFRKELADIDNTEHIDLRTRDIWGFADILFDGLIADMAVQNRINNARQDVSRIIEQVEGILETLRLESE